MLPKLPESKHVREKNPVTAANHLGRNLKFVSTGWFAFFFNVWLEGKIASGLLLAAVLTAVYWTIGTSIEKVEYRGDDAISTSRAKN
jgi:hypothetical protein